MDNTTRRTEIEVTPAEPQGHVVRERTQAEAEQRSVRNPYRHVPLTGCHQSMLPCYRSFAAVGRLADFQLDEQGLNPENPQLPGLDALWDVDKKGEVCKLDEEGVTYYGVLNSDGERLSKADLDADAQLWLINYNRHVRAQFTQNNDHMCSKTCTKYADQGAQNKGITLRNARQMICRFLFFPYHGIHLHGRFEREDQESVTPWEGTRLYTVFGGDERKE